MSRAARSRLATALTILLIAVLIGAGLLTRGGQGASSAPQPVSAVAPPAAAAAPASATAPAPAPEPAALPVSEDDDDLGEELGDD